MFLTTFYILFMVKLLGWLVRLDVSLMQSCSWSWTLWIWLVLSDFGICTKNVTCPSKKNFQGFLSVYSNICVFFHSWLGHNIINIIIIISLSLLSPEFDLELSGSSSPWCCIESLCLLFFLDLATLLTFEWLFIKNIWCCWIGFESDHLEFHWY